MKCRACFKPLQYVHGHGACLYALCRLYGQNQAPCCEGETAVNSEAAASELPVETYLENLHVEKTESLVRGDDEVGLPSPMFEVAPGRSRTGGGPVE